ncbi:SirB1 family protein [Psychromonas hadalis]|uniref:SirB1 family protein n=1 Tax=Psychromonas hadalis TaxID=211669 RepID=UPI0003B5E64A|nr:tetratricopeptide repeat protein [Psychromonas hadalis]
MTDISQGMISPRTENSAVMMTDQFDFEKSSLLDAALVVESEITGLSIDKFEDSLRLQQLVINSKLSSFESANKAKLIALIDLLYQQQGYEGDWKAFFKVKNALISRVFARRKGIPISLGILLLDFLQLCEFDAQGICFPSGFIIRITLENEVVYFDPFTGELPSWESLELKVRGQLGNLAKLTLDMLKPDSHETIIKRFINVLKAAYIQAGRSEIALLCSDILLRLDPDDAYEVRDRGFLFQQLDCLSLARNDFEYFMKHHPQDPMVHILQKQIQEMNFINQVIH